MGQFSTPRQLRLVFDQPDCTAQILIHRLCQWATSHSDSHEISRFSALLRSHKTGPVFAFSEPSGIRMAGRHARPGQVAFKGGCCLHVNGIHPRANGGSHAARWRPSEPWMKSAFLKAGHLPTLIACFLYFDLSFMVWVLLGPMAVLIAHDLNLNPGQKGLMVAVPVLAGALLRIVNGILVGQL